MVDKGIGDMGGPGFQVWQSPLIPNGPIVAVHHMTTT